MPGHKRNCALSPYLKTLGAEYDITEINGFDDLHDANGMLAKAMERAAGLWGSRDAYFLVNGSTCGILAGIRAATLQEDKVLVARNAHKSVYHAMELCNLEPIFMMPSTEPSFGIFGSICPEEVERALEQNPDVRLVVLTSPTYEGVISDIAGVCEAAHTHNIPVLVDEAHGAHLGFSDYFSGGSVKAGADIVVQSLHKTLPSLTQTALLHLNGDLVQRQNVARQLSIFETSSPSYLLMASIDGCVQLLAQQGKELFCAWEEMLRKFDEMIIPLSHLRVLAHGTAKDKQFENIYLTDPGKIVISTRGTTLSGSELMMILREKYFIELEMAAGDYVIAMTGLGDTEKTLTSLAQALIEIDKSCKSTQMNKVARYPKLPELVCDVTDALQGEHILVPAKEAAGKISADYLWAYPPGIPLIIPGERIDEDLIMYISESEYRGIHIKSTFGNLPDTFAVLQNC